MTIKITEGTDESAKEAHRKQLLHLQYKASKINDRLKKIREEKELSIQDLSSDLSVLKATAIFDEPG